MRLDIDYESIELTLFKWQLCLKTSKAIKLQELWFLYYLPMRRWLNNELSKARVDLGAVGGRAVYPFSYGHPSNFHLLSTTGPIDWYLP